jgi:hypothetical protein
LRVFAKGGVEDFVADVAEAITVVITFRDPGSDVSRAHRTAH